MQFAKLLPTLLLAAMPAAYVETDRVTRAPSETNQDDTTTDIDMVNRRFVNALYIRVERALLDEREEYDDQLIAIHLREADLKKKLAETQEKRRLTEQKLNFKKNEQKELSNKLKKVNGNDEKAEILKRLAAVSKERDEAEAVVVKLKSDEQAIKETLDFRIGWSFASKGALLKERDRINGEWWKITSKKMDWQVSYSPKQFSAFKNLLMKAAESAALACNVIIISENDSGETTGAVIKYQTAEQRQFGARPTTAKCTTRCSDQLSPERYYVWTERNNKPTSDRNEIFSIARENEKVTLRESPE